MNAHLCSPLPVDRALTSLLEDDVEGALRWCAAALERDPAPIALIATARALLRADRVRAAVDGLRLAAERAVEGGDLPLALVAIDDLRATGVEVGAWLEHVAESFQRAATTRTTHVQPRLEIGRVEPLSEHLRGGALAAKVTQVLYETIGVERRSAPPEPLFGALGGESLRDLVELFGPITVPAKHRVIEAGEVCETAYVVAYGEVEISSKVRGADSARSTARLDRGAFFGETALLARLPSAFTVTTTRPSILLVADRTAMDALGARRADVRAELDAHCRRHAVANLGGASAVISAIPAAERAALVDRVESRVFERGERLADEGDEVPGLHVVVSGEVAMVARDGGDRVVLGTVGPGDTVGEVELVLCRKARADAIAVRRTATLFLPRDGFHALVDEHPAVLHVLYGLAVRRQAETRSALESESTSINDEFVIEERGAARLRAIAAGLGAAPPRGSTVAQVSFSSVPPPAAPPSVVPVAASVLPPREASSRAPLARYTMQGAAVVAVAASVAAVLSVRDGHPGAVDPGAGVAAVAGAAQVTESPPFGPPPPSASPSPPPHLQDVPASRSATRPRPSAVAPTMKARPTPTGPVVSQAPSGAPATPPPAAAASADDFGGRE